MVQYNAIFGDPINKAFIYICVNFNPIMFKVTKNMNMRGMMGQTRLNVTWTI